MHFPARWLAPTLALVALVFLLAACGPAEHPGKAVFAGANCKACHRVGHSGGDSGPDLSFVGFRRRRDWLDAWLESPRHWKPSALMPSFRLADGDRRVLADYLALLQGQDFGPRRPWAAAAGPLERGRLLYLKAGCVACHGAAGKGGEPNVNVAGGAIPALDQIVATYTQDELVSRIRRGSSPTREDPSGPEPVAMPAWGQVLSDGELDDLAAYLLTLAPAGAGTEGF